MKLNYKRTIYVGLAFFIITIFWQTYDTVIARILIDKFGLSQFASGIVMALDNILALILLPVFGALSDKANFKRGKRTPFIIVGTIIGALAFMGLSFVDHKQSTDIQNSGTYTSQTEYQEALGNKTYDDWFLTIEEIKTHYDAGSDEYNFYIENTYEEINSFLNENGVLKEGLVNARDNKDIKDSFYNYLSHKSWQVTKANFFNLVLFLLILLVALLSMSFFRSPAVALMPDVTIKPLRSRANAVINLMGSISAIFALGFLMATKRDVQSFVSYWPAFVYTGVMMLIVLYIFIIKVDEPQFVLDKLAEDEKYGLTEDEEENLDGKSALSNLPKPVLKSLILILLSVFLWFMGYNAVISKVSDYAPKMLNMGSGLPTIIAHAVAILSFIPIGRISSKIGRRKAILIGIVILTVAFGSVTFLTESTGFVMYIVFAFVGIGWATINVNSFPMVVELAKGGDVGKFTGYYYFFSMAAQIITPIFSGFLMDTSLGREILFPYSALFVALSFITMLFVKHGDSKFEAKKGLEAFDIED